MMDLRCQQPLLMESPHNTHKQKALLEFFLIANTKAVSNKGLRMQVFGQYSVCQWSQVKVETIAVCSYWID